MDPAWACYSCVLDTYIDDNLFVGPKAGVAEVKSKFMKNFNCTECGDLDEYMGLKLQRDGEGPCGRIIMTQPVLIQKLKDEYDTNLEGGK